MVDKFMEFVHAQTAMAEEDTQEAMSVEREKTRWLDHLEVLRKFVDGALAAYAEAGIKMSTKMVTVTEEQTGPYKAPQVEITVGPAVVKLKPIGTFLIGAFGRVDMEGSRGSCSSDPCSGKSAIPFVRIQYRSGPGIRK